MNPAEWLVRTARLKPNVPALMVGTNLVADYGEFARRAAAIGGALQSGSGVKAKDRVAIFMANSTQYLEAFYGALFAGAAVVPINAKLHAREAAWIIEDSGAKVVFISDSVGAPLRELVPDDVQVISSDGVEFAALYAAPPLEQPARMSAGEMVWLFYTSGTTGKPKGVMISSANLTAMALGYFADVDDVDPEGATLYAAPMSHGAGIYNFMHVIRGARHVVAPSLGFDADEILDLAPKLGKVSMFAAPTMVRRLVDRAKARGETGEGLKTIVYAGGPMYLTDIIEAVEVMGPRFVQIYGQGECPMAITVLSRERVADRSHLRWKERLASVGLAQSCSQVRIGDEDGLDLPLGEIGEIMVAGIPVMLGYWQNAEATEKTIQNGWLRTGDMGAIDEDGFVTLHDRSKDMIISGGSNIYPREVEEALLSHPSVREVSVVGQFDAEWGETVTAFVVVSEPVSEATLDQHCLDLIARFKRPKAYHFIEALPKNNYGKVLKTDLRARLKKAD